MLQERPGANAALITHWPGSLYASAIFTEFWLNVVISSMVVRRKNWRFKKGFGGFSNTPLDTILRNMGVTTCVVSGVTTYVCVSTTVRGGVEHNYRMILVKDAVAEVSRNTYEAELETMDRLFADVNTTDEVVAMLAGVSSMR